MSGQQRNGESTQPLMFSRPERRNVSRHMTLATDMWRMVDDYANSLDGSWLSDEERSDIGPDSTADSEYLPIEDPYDTPVWSLDKIQDFYSDRTP